MASMVAAATEPASDATTSRSAPEPSRRSHALLAARAVVAQHDRNHLRLRDANLVGVLQHGDALARRRRREPAPRPSSMTTRGAGPDHEDVRARRDARLEERRDGTRHRARRGPGPRASTRCGALADGEDPARGGGRRDRDHVRPAAEPALDDEPRRLAAAPPTDAPDARRHAPARPRS